MHFHLPKPLHGWREFAGEVGIIVLGVLIALAAEQAIETTRWHEKVERTKDLLDSELHDDALSAYGWLATGRCLDQQLNAAESAVAAARSSGAITATAPYRPELDVFTSDAWVNARSLEVTDHMSPETIRTYSRLFFFPTELQSNIVQLHQLAAELQPVATGVRNVSSGEAGEYQRLIAEARELQNRTELAQKILIIRATRAQIRLSAKEMKQAVVDRKAVHGACAGSPDLSLQPGD
ncbi:MAG TPA: hypothetical protein VGU01_10165 [Sphingomicrobium sp.]|nr:hypothetical protein [Sphingomicrobium sp.]